MAIVAAPASAQSLIDGDADAGKAKSITCTACHGPEGNSATPLWPNLAGQNARYLADQLKAFQDPNPNDDKGPKRSDPLMTSQAMLLSNQDIYDLAVYFESLPGASQAVADPSSVARAEAIYRGGDTADGVPACLACHGADRARQSRCRLPGPQWPACCVLRQAAAGLRVGRSPLR